MDRDEIEEQMNAPLIPLIQPANSSDITVARIQCAKIVRRGTDHAVRYRRKSMWLRILKYSYPDLDIDVHQPPDMKREWPRPLKSPFPCWNCHRRFQGPPIFMPRQMLDRRVEEHGNFCSAPCVNTYIRDHPNANSAAIAAELYTYMRTVHGFKGAEIGFAPRFDQHTTYGGDEDDAAFDEIIGNPTLTTSVLLVPYIPGDSVVEWKYNAGTDAELVQLPPFAYIPPNTATGGAGILASDGALGGGADGAGGGGGATGGSVASKASLQQSAQSTVAKAALAAYLAKHGAEAAVHVPGLATTIGVNANDTAPADALSNAVPGNVHQSAVAQGAQVFPAPQPQHTAGASAVSAPMQYLAAVMRAAPQPTGDEDPVHDTKHIRQKPLAEIQKRLMELPPQERRAAEYDMFLERYPMDEDLNLSDDDPLPPPPPKKANKNAKKKADGSSATTGAGSRSASNAPALKAVNAVAFLPQGLTVADLVANNMHGRLLPGGAAAAASVSTGLKAKTASKSRAKTASKKAKTVTFAVMGAESNAEENAAPPPPSAPAAESTDGGSEPEQHPAQAAAGAVVVGAPKRPKSSKKRVAAAVTSDDSTNCSDTLLIDEQAASSSTKKKSKAQDNN
jgi:hypothetical protein